MFSPAMGITEGAFFQGQIEMQPPERRAENSATLRQAALAPSLDGALRSHVGGS